MKGKHSQMTIASVGQLCTLHKVHAILYLEYNSTLKLQSLFYWEEYHSTLKLGPVAVDGGSSYWCQMRL